MLTELSRIEFTTVIGADHSLTTLVKDAPLSLTTLSCPGPQGRPGLAGPSGLEADVSTDFALIYHLST